MHCKIPSSRRIAVFCSDHVAGSHHGEDRHRREHGEGDKQRRGAERKARVALVAIVGLAFGVSACRGSTWVVLRVEHEGVCKCVWEGGY